jgi:hypothetical protein
MRPQRYPVRRILAASILLAVALMLFAPSAARSSETLIVHEWGTFTSFHDAAGATIPGINVDDEPVPSFVHRLPGFPIRRAGAYPARWSQGAPSCHADVTLRLETPVLYFYPRSGFRFDEPIDVEASFPGGWLTEFYPAAAVDVPGFPGQLTASAKGRLHWRALKISQEPSTKLAATSERVWLAPREVQSAVITTADGKESEKYLFYRGVGHLDAPLIVRQREEALTVALRDGEALKALPPSWLVRVLPDGGVWYRRLNADANAREVIVSLPRDEAVSARDALPALRRELAGALVAQGLYADEAKAMLDTWQLSYFASEGLRLFFLLPQTWTDSHLPLAVSVPAEVTRVMMGRIELVSATARGALAKLQALPAESLRLTPLYVDLLSGSAEFPKEQRVETSRNVMHRLRDQSGSHAEFYRAFGRTVPEPLRLYDSLGRFRDALIAHEWRSAPDESTRARLKGIIDTFSSCVPAERVASQ